MAKTRPEEVNMIMGGGGGQGASQSPNPTLPDRVGELAKPKSFSTLHLAALQHFLTHGHAFFGPLTMVYIEPLSNTHNSHTTKFPTVDVSHNVLRHGVLEMTLDCLVAWWPRQDLKK